MDQEIYLIGLNHKSAPVEIREKAALSGETGLERRLLATAPGLRECLVLSTCNRVEILAVGDRSPTLPEGVLAAWAAIRRAHPAELRPYVYMHAADDAVRHLFMVASSLDSMVVGEPQILGQLKKAYRTAVEEGSARVIVNRALHKAFSVAKRVRTETGVGSSAVSISYAAVELAKRIFDDLTDKTAMLVGAGEMAELAATHLLNCGVKKILVANRTFARADELARKFSGERGEPVLFDNFLERLPEADIVISSTGSPTAIIRARDVKSVLKKRRNEPMFFIDIAVPRDVDPDVNNLDNVYLYDIDDLSEVVEENLSARASEAQKARSIVAAEALEFRRWLDSLELSPTIVDLLAMAQDVGERELARTLRRLPNLDEATRQALDELVASIGRKMLHEPILFLKRRAREEGSARKFIDVTRRMFNLDNETAPEDAHADRLRQADAQGAVEFDSQEDDALINEVPEPSAESLTCPDPDAANTLKH